MYIFNFDCHNLIDSVSVSFCFYFISNKKRKVKEKSQFGGSVFGGNELSKK